MSDIASLTADLWLLTCLAGYFLVTLHIILLVLRFRAYLHRDHTFRPSWFTLFFTAFIAAALVLTCYWQPTFPPPPGRW